LNIFVVIWFKNYFYLSINLLWFEWRGRLSDAVW